MKYVTMDAELTDLRSRYDWLAAPPSVPEQQVVRDLSKSISACLSFVLLVARPGRDPGESGVFPECPGTFRSVQICGHQKELNVHQRPPKSSHV